MSTIRNYVVRCASQEAARGRNSAQIRGIVVALLVINHGMSRDIALRCARAYV